MGRARNNSTSSLPERYAQDWANLIGEEVEDKAGGAKCPDDPEWCGTPDAEAVKPKPIRPVALQKRPLRLADWTVEHVASWMSSTPLPAEAAAKLREHDVNGPVLASLSEHDLLLMGFEKFGWRRQLLLSREEMQEELKEKQEAMESPAEWMDIRSYVLTPTVSPRGRTPDEKRKQRPHGQDTPMTNSISSAPSATIRGPLSFTPSPLTVVASPRMSYRTIATQQVPVQRAVSAVTIPHTGLGIDRGTSPPPLAKVAVRVASSATLTTPRIGATAIIPTVYTEKIRGVPTRPTNASVLATASCTTTTTTVRTASPAAFGCRRSPSASSTKRVTSPRSSILRTAPTPSRALASSSRLDFGTPQAQLAPTSPVKCRVPASPAPSRPSSSPRAQSPAMVASADGAASRATWGSSSASKKPRSTRPPVPVMRHVSASQQRELQQTPSREPQTATI
eukprot:gnl/TRDRNA2_/TRDRNA2_192430_c0_seq1.p1 gnl/TRDRNA2_/TRDRNA2_192430_c0~~gnl/TRDRNA2_/TRDRNA2_192430_c0_seq1.p1  ORF type:complete len:451 (+),score=54.99 gnl/TRDRNA2_/TRDRNA2_192430_c0_seq1:80-1432(+)